MDAVCFALSDVRGNMHPRTRTTTETISWQWPCGAACKMVRQVTTSCPHGCRCWHGHGAPAPYAGHHPHNHHHHHHQQQQHQEEVVNHANAHALQGTHRALAAEESNAGRSITVNPAAPVVAEFWVPDPYLMVQQLREFESLNDEAIALRVQLEEYTEEIEKSKDNDGRNWFLALPDNIRNVLVMARDAINSYIAISTPPAK
ncbi:hypothetical protein EJB05_45385, partial [Eragrostis curvula]